MATSSLRLRLSLAAAALIAIALFAGGVALLLIFDSALDRRTADELNQTARYLAGEVAFAPDGAIEVERPPADPRFASAYGGLYWQIDAAGRQSVRSRSLWDKRLDVPAPTSAMVHHETIDLPAPDGGALIAVVRTVQLRTPPGAPLAVIAVGLDRRQLQASRSAALALIAPSLAVLAAALSLAMAVFIHRALRPFRLLRGELARVRSGAAPRLSGDHAAEVRPLVEDLNRLIELHEEAIVRARAEAGDMAHGLKTPLAVLDAISRRIAATEPVAANEIAEQAQAMQRQVGRSLARARSAAASGLARRSAAVSPVAEELVAAMRQLRPESELAWIVEIDPAARYPASEGELLEMLGNLLDNARKWAKGRANVRAIVAGAGGAITVEDDGPGMTETDVARVQRGLRWDETMPGTGFGLAISRDLARATGGRLELSSSPLGGLRATIAW